MASSEVPGTSGLAAYSDASPTPFHLVEYSASMLDRAGFTRLDEKTSWTGKIAAGGKYYFDRNGSTIVAFTVGTGYSSGNAFKVLGAHTDSPVLKVKPVSKKSSHGFIQVGVECYGGGLWHTWFDRELTVAGRVIVKTADGGFESRLVNVEKPILRVPNLCIHLQSAEERKAFSPNKETHLQPIIAMSTGVERTLNEESPGDERHCPVLVKLLASSVGCAPDDIKDCELTLCDTQRAQVWGPSGEFFSAPRLDNQVHCYTGLMALLSHASSGALETDTSISMVACFDHEEVGSQSACGAGSPVFKDAIERVSAALLQPGNDADEAVKIAIQKSFLISADVAHSIHPNYASKHDSNHQPVLNGGTVLKTNDNQRYATDVVSGFFFREISRRAGENSQEFMVRNDCPCGTTIGPIISGAVGIRTVDVGVPSLSMHSIRETIGVADIISSFKVFLEFFAGYDDLYSKFTGF